MAHQEPKDAQNLLKPKPTKRHSVGLKVHFNGLLWLQVASSHASQQLEIYKKYGPEPQIDSRK